MHHREPLRHLARCLKYPGVNVPYKALVGAGDGMGGALLRLAALLRIVGGDGEVAGCASLPGRWRS